MRKFFSKILNLLFNRYNKHLYLEKAGISAYPENHWGGIDSYKPVACLRNLWRSKKEKRKTGVDPRDCWDLDTTFYLWLYEHLCQLLKDTNADLTWQKFQHNDKEYTEEEYIEYLKKLLLDIINFDEYKNCPKFPPDEYRENDDGTTTVICTASEELKEEFRNTCAKNNKECEELRKEICDVFYELLPALWW